jgi:hypothetical protein
MGEIVVRVPEDIKKEFPDVNWEGIARKAIRDEVRKHSVLRMYNRLLGQSRLTDEDALRLGKDVNRSLRKRIEQEMDV